MADNYLEKRFEQFEHPRAKVIHRGGPSLDSLLLRNRSTRGFLKEHKVCLGDLRSIIEVNTRIASSKNQQALRFVPVTAGPDADFVNGIFKMGALFRAGRADCPPERECDYPLLPLPGTEPEAFILVYGTHPEDASLLIDLGISLQSMSLKAAEMGLSCLMVRAFDREAAMRFVQERQLYPLAILCVGKGAEKIFLKPTRDKTELGYFRKDGIHFVPKLTLDEIIIQQ